MSGFIYLRTLIVISISLVCVVGVRSQTVFPSVLEHVTPNYPPAARAVGAVGVVQISVEVDSTGKVISAIALTGHPLLRRMAEVTVEKWKFSSEPGHHFLTISIEFRLGDQDDDKAIIRGPYYLKVLGYRPRLTD